VGDISYYYLISSLPLLRLDEPPPFTSAAFLDTCREQLSPGRFDALLRVTLMPGDWKTCCESERLWDAWETQFRNSLVRRRAAVLGLDPESWIRPASEVWVQLDRQVEEAMNAGDPWQCELALDRLRWQHLSDLEAGHSFDFDKVVIYRLQLLLVEKRAAYDSERGGENRDRLLEGIVGTAHAHRTVLA